MTEKTLHILVVEDNPADVDYVRALLPTSGPKSFHIESVTRISDALPLLKSHPIDLILLDLNLPDSHGLPTFHQMKQATPDIPVIILTGTDDQKLAVTAVRDGAQDFLVKGLFNESLLTRAIHYAVARETTESALRALLREKDVLLKEIHHRVKNNLQIMSSLLHLQAANSDEHIVKVALQDMQNRVLSMALIHSHLYRSDNLSTVDMVAYLKTLGEQLLSALTTIPATIQLHLNLSPVQLAIDQAIPCGLLANELITNALKHAFPDGRSGELRIALQPIADGQEIRLSVADNGVGLPPDFALGHLTSLGLPVALGLARQLGGQLKIGAGPGTMFELTFPSHHAGPHRNDHATPFIL